LLEDYRQHIQERADQGVVPQPLSPEQTSALIELLKSPPAGVDQAA
jgi:aconitate hydratase 2/2-methylisocitrate dehydratase